MEEDEKKEKQKAYHLNLEIRKILEAMSETI